ncbi:glycoside hydrolase family 3 C-terminal domain-containing protein [Robinsoniella sp. KNHs210]|uniref:glycoside hydrolase family 3 C-terminal domain-containing protein n=1 Tax=Robinsoniella sp. KNHs210 TaxID=1469950 RepID=UPI0006939B0B|nr:glycoside hydrolase family 3 C-terminal domain-containing protein [Robinsoniella sp. KNHs210]
MKIAKRLLAMLMSIILLLGTVSSGITVSAKELPSLASISKQAANEAMVLLKNENNVLPLAGKTISVFGRTQINTFYTGYGSGGYVTPSYITTIIDGLRQNPNIKVNEDLAKVYTDWERANPGSNITTGNNWRDGIHSLPEMPLENNLVTDAAKKSDTAVIVIGRRFGEGVDLKMGANDGSYYLTTAEKDMLRQVSNAFDEVVVVFNTGSVMDMEWIAKQEYDIDAYILAWQGGMESGRAIAEVLAGDVNPSGKLPVTIANRYSDYTTSKDFANQNVNVYEEDIFLGYRYFETFRQDAVLYPFGYGLSYTTFDTETTGVTVTESSDGITDDTINVQVKVTNTGDYAGKETVQIYYGAPQGKLGKSSRSLAAYTKTGIIQPGESQDMSISFRVGAMASYDDAGKTGHRFAYVLEAGIYPIYVGNSVRAPKADGYEGYVVDKLTLVEQLQEVSPPAENFNRITASDDGNGNIVQGSEAVPKAVRTADDYEKRILSAIPDEIKPTGNKGISLRDVYDKKNTIEDFVAQLSDDDIAKLCRGAGGMNDSQGIPGNASAFGGHTDSLKKFGVIVASTCDGPSGIRHTGSASVIPSGISMASTWNDDLVEAVYKLLGQECVLNKVDVLLAPGMNIIRDPACGRNYEYFSEDPVLSGKMGASYTKGLQSAGIASTLKHYVGNNKGQINDKFDARMSERALREIYLKGFEIAVKESNPYTIMTGVNRVNGEYVNYSFDLCTTILRDEWGWDGMVMTDWGPRADSYTGSRGTLTNHAYLVQAQCDVSMSGRTHPNTLEPSLAASDGITRAEVQRSAINCLKYLLKSPAFARANNLELYPYQVPEDQIFTVEKAETGNPRLDAIYLDGEKITNFDPLVLDYVLYSRDLADTPNVTYDASADINVELISATPEIPITTIKTSAGGVENIYRVIFSNQAGMPVSVENPKYAYLNGIQVNGVEVPGFYVNRTNYEMKIDGNLEDAEVTYMVPDGVSASYTIDEEQSTIIIRSESDHQAIEYYVKCISGVSAPQSDNFESEELNDFWTVLNQNENFSKHDGYIQIITENGSWNAGDTANPTANNIVAQSGAGDWDSVTHATFDATAFSETHQSFGIKIMEGNSDRNFIWFRYEYVGGTSNGPSAIRVNKMGTNAAQITRNHTYPKNEDTLISDSLYFKVTKRENTYTFSVSVDGENYTPMGATTQAYNNPTFALAAYNSASTKPMEVQFDYVTFEDKSTSTPEPEVPEPTVIKPVSGDDTNRLQLGETPYYLEGMVSANGSGSETGKKTLGSTSPGAYALYNVDVEESGYYNLSMRWASPRTWPVQTDFALEADGILLTKWTMFEGTGGWTNWATLDPQRVYLAAGRHRLKLYIIADGPDLSWLQFDHQPSQPVTIGEADDVAITIDGRSDVVPGDTVRFNVVAEGDREISGVFIQYGDQEIRLEVQQNGYYSFVMPDASVTITATTIVSVMNAPGSETVTYEGAAIDLSELENLFDIAEGAGEATYSIENTKTATGAGKIDPNDGRTLTVTKAGTFAIGLITQATPTHAAGEKVTAVLTVNKGSQTKALAAPTVSSKTETSVTLSSTAGMEYKRDNEKWQTSPVFTGLTPNKEYQFYQRLAETDVYIASPVSKVLMVKTEAKGIVVENTVYAVTLDPNGGKLAVAADGKRNVKKDNKIGALPTPIRDNYNFRGWYTARTGGSLVSADYKVSANVIIYARWEKKVSPKKGYKFKSGNLNYKVTKAATAKTTGSVQVTGPAKKTLQKITIPSTVKSGAFTFRVESIAKKAFMNNKKLKTVKVGSNVKQIDTKAFSGCKVLTKVTVGKGVIKIGSEVFLNDKKLKTITIQSKKLKTVGKNAFKNIYKKASIKVPASKRKQYRKLLNGKGQAKTVKIG